MAQLSCYLPPFAGDYSGACSALFELDCLVVILDAGCCTRNYTEYEEPRWRKVRKSTFSAQLRTLDVALGDEESIIAEVVSAANQLHPSSVALIGTPVPALVGMDLDGMALEVEARTRLTCFGVPTTGFDTYEKGISKVLLHLAQMSEAHKEQKDDACSPNQTFQNGDEKAPLFKVNIFGLTPLDYACKNDIDHLSNVLSANGIHANFTTMAPANQQLDRLGDAHANVVLSWSGLEAAYYMEHSFGIPYIIGFPFDKDMEHSLLEHVKKHTSGVLWKPQIEKTEQTHAAETSSEQKSKVYLIGEQVIMCSLRAALRNRSDAQCKDKQLHVCSLFSMAPELMEPADSFLASEKDLLDLVRINPGACFVGDSLLRQIPAMPQDLFFDLSHAAISSHLFSTDEKGMIDLFKKIK